MGIFQGEKAGSALQQLVTAGVCCTAKGQDRGGCVLGVSMTMCCCRHMLRAEVHGLVLPSLVQSKAFLVWLPEGIYAPGAKP